VAVSTSSQPRQEAAVRPTACACQGQLPVRTPTSRCRPQAVFGSGDLATTIRSLLCAIDVYASLAYDLSVIFLETPVFTRQIRELVEDDQYRELQSVLVARPDAGDLIPRSGGLRKIRVAVSGRGKRGGARVIYYWVVAKDQIYMLLAYAKNVQDDLTEEQLKTLRALIRQEFG
jgi:hypothetical protein